jgi:anthranilate synthase component I
MRVAADSEIRLEPSLEGARELAREGNVVPVRARFVDDCETPVSAFLKLRAGEPEGAPCFLLESAEQGQVGRYSFVGLRPRALLRWSEGTLSEWSNEEAAAGEPPGRTEPAPDPYAAVAARMAEYRPAPVEGLPPFAGGAVGFFAYDLVRTVEPLGEPNPDRLGLPDLALMVTDAMLVFDHLRHELTILACAFVEDGGSIDAAYERAAATIAEMRERLRAAVPPPEHPTVSEPPLFESNMEREEFEAAVARIVEYVHAGDAFQVVPSQRFSAPAPVEAFSVYRGLRAVNPSPYMYFLEFGDFQIAGASPEPLVKVIGDRVETRPIAGTYPRGGSEDEDRQLAEKLKNDPKERAEHVMLVDLGRNDLCRVCR